MYERQWSFCVPIFDAQKKLFSAPTKFVPLSDQIIEGVPRLEMKRSKLLDGEFLMRLPRDVGYGR